LGRLQILFVENDVNIQERMQRALGQVFTVECVASVTEAKSYLDTSVPDILISEVVVGLESGLDLCSYIRSVPALCSLPMMLLTSLATVQDKVAGFTAGTDDYVVKPCDARHLIARIRLLFRIKHLERYIAMI
jgi:DNA-binding response OmpR family regulator